MKRLIGYCPGYHACFLLFTFLLSCKTPAPVITDKPCCDVEQVCVAGFQNLYKIDNQLYRSEQPTVEDMTELEKLGVKTVFNLRNLRKDKYEARDTCLVLVQVPMNAWTISYDEIVVALKQIQAAKKPVLVHCKHGSDRTGAVVAAYRMVNGMSKEDAIREFLDYRYGYHGKWFPNILKLLESIDVERLKKDVNQR